MEGGIDPDATLDYVEFHLFPSQNRFEAIAWSSNREENVASGPLEQLLLLDSPEIKTLSNKVSDTTFKILPPANVNDASWFTAAALTRFLHFIGLPDVLDIGNEISQLEETRNFQLSLFDKAEADITTSVESKNELLLAVDLRLTALKKEVASAFNQAVGSKSSPKEVSDIKTFGFHFGTKNLRDSLQNFVESITISTEYEEDSTVSSENDEPSSVERSRGLTRSATPRRSASPMRRIQIGRSGSRRAASLSIKSLNYFPVKEKSTSHGDADGDSSEEDSQRPVKNNVTRMSVQDKISLFESKQRDQGVADVHKTKTSVGANKAVLRRWSSAIGEKAEMPENSPNSVEPDSIINKTETCVETSENMLLVSETGASEQCRVDVDTPEPERDESCEKNELFNELMESMPQKVTSDNSRNKSPKEQRGGLYDLYKKKREEKLQMEASRKIVEKEAKTTSGSTKVIGANRRLYATNELQKTQKNSSPLTSSRTKPSSVKKSTSKDSRPSPLPATRKSWPSTPSPARTQMASTSTNSTPTNRKPQSASSIVRSSTKVENVQPKLKTPKAAQKDTNKTVKAMNEKKQAKVTENKRMTKTADTTATAKPSIYNKVTKKSSVVPLETKPFLRKGSGTGPSVGPVIKTKMNKVATRINITSQNQENEYEPVETRASLDLEPQVVSLGPTKCEELESSGDGGGSRAEVSEINTLVTEELEIPPTAWVVGEEHQQDEIVSCKESPVQTSSPPNVETPAGFVRPRVRHSLSQMLLEDSNEVEVDEWGNAEHPPTMVYQKDAPRGLKRLLKFARKAKADSHLTAGGWSSPSAFSEGEDDIEESKGQSSLSRYSVQNHHRVPEGHASASMNTTKATRSFFSLSAFRGNKTNETKLLQH
ncbi:hypothetical protein Hanom_Chr14g01331271 [Helianthus anomalus]